MPSTHISFDSGDFLSFADSVLEALRKASSKRDLGTLMEEVSADMGFHFYALIHHDDLRASPVNRVDIKQYPAEISDRLIYEAKYRRDPVIRGCLFSGSAFLWSDLGNILQLDAKDRESFSLGKTAGLNEGITVPYVRLGDCMGSCTFAGTRSPELAHRYLGIAQMVGTFAFQAALRLIGILAYPTAKSAKLHPRPRDCVILAGQGLSNKEIARALALTPRTVDGYMTEARRLFDAHDRTELVVSAVLAGEIGLHEIRRQPEHSLGL